MKEQLSKTIGIIQQLVNKAVQIQDKAKSLLSVEEFNELLQRCQVLSGLLVSVPENDVKTYVYTVSGAGSKEVNGDYWDTGELVEGYPSYENANGVKIYCQIITGLGQWVIHSPSGGDHLYAAWWNGDTVYNPLEACIYWRTMDGANPLPTITIYSGSVGDQIDINDVLANPKNYAVLINGAVQVMLDGHGKPTGDEQDYSGTYDDCDHHRAGIDEPVDQEEPDADYIVWSRTDYIMPWFIHDPNSICYGTKGHKWCIYLSGEILWYCDDEIPGPSSKWVWDYDHDGLYFAPGGDVNVKFIKK